MRTVHAQVSRVQYCFGRFGFHVNISKYQEMYLAPSSMDGSWGWTRLLHYVAKLRSCAVHGHM